MRLRSKRLAANRDGLRPTFVLRGGCADSGYESISEAPWLYDSALLIVPTTQYRCGMPYGDPVCGGAWSCEKHPVQKNWVFQLKY